ncbi:unnamed protein product [Choristocarpus tenellus]
MDQIVFILREWDSMRDLLNTLGKTVLDVGNFGMLLVLFMYIYALVGLQFFANRFHFDSEGRAIGIGEEGYYTADVPRSNFDSLENAFTTIFQILSGENWNTVMYDGWRATSWISVFYFLSLIMVGMMIIMNLFLAILLSNFTNKEEGEVEPGMNPKVAPSPPAKKGSELLTLAHSDVAPANSPVRSLGRGRSTLEASGADSGRGGGGFWGPRRGEKIVPDQPKPGNEKVVEEGNVVEKGKGWKSEKEIGGSFDRTCAALQRVIEESLRVPELDPGNALFVLGPGHPLRRTCAAVVANSAFDKIILTLISVSSVTLAIDNPLTNPESDFVKILSVTDVVMTTLFTIEMALKVFACGFALMPGAYMRNSWNVLDFVVVCISIAGLYGGSSNLKSLRSLRALRALRPLRMINRAPGLKIVVNALFAAIPDVLNVAAVCFMFFLIFAILGVNYFKGVLMSCQGEEYDDLHANITSFITNPVSWDNMGASDRAWFGPLSNVTKAFSVGGYTAADCAENGWPDSAPCCPFWPSLSSVTPTSFEVCKCLGLTWDKTIPQQFDNVIEALLTFFEISTTEGWADVMYAAVDATEEDMQPKRDHNLLRVWFFMLFMLVGSYLVMNLFVGVIIDNFNKMKSKAEGGGVLVTEEQQSWIKTQQMTHRLKPLKRMISPKNLPGALCYKVALHPSFEGVIMVCITVNTVVMAMQYFGQGDIYTMITECANYTFAFIFTLEAVAAFRWAYFVDPWNCFDMFIVLGTNAGLVLLWVTGLSYGSIATIIRTFRIGRVLRLVRGLKSMSQLFNTLLLTLPSLGNVGALLFLIFFIYAVMGVQLFSKVALNGALDEHANFQNFWRSIVLLLRFSTGENWNGFMYDMAADRENCDSDPDYDSSMCGFNDRPGCIPLNGCGNSSIFPYMISFTLTVTFVFMNLFIGVILDGFDAASANENDIIKLEDFNMLAEHWAEFDPNATCFMSVSDLQDFLQSLLFPWGFGEGYQASTREIRRRIQRLNLHIFEGNRVHFKVSIYFPL